MKEFADLSAAAEISSVHCHGHTGPSQAIRQKVKGPERASTARILDLSLAKTRTSRNALPSTTGLFDQLRVVRRLALWTGYDPTHQLRCFGRTVVVDGQR
jgi:hypothetical protein